MRNSLLTIGLVCVAGLMVACGRSQIVQPLITDKPGDIEQEMDYWHALADRPITSNNDAMHGLILLSESKDTNTSYEQRLQWLKDRGYLSGGFNAPANEAVQCGTIAQILVQILKIEGGLTMRLIGPHPRYATRELIYLEILSPHTPQQAMTGIEFVGLISKAEYYMEAKP